MKMLATSLMLIFIMCFTGCDATRQAQVTDIPLVIKVECRNENSVTQMVLHHLKVLSPRDLEIKDDGPFVFIEAVYANVTADQFKKYANAEQLIKMVSGVSNVEIWFNQKPQKNDFRTLRNN